MIYLDSAAIVKLVHAEPGSPALRRWLDKRAETGWISSVLTEIESFRALARYAPGAVSRLPAVLDQIDLIDLDQAVRILARAVQPGHSAQPGCHSPRHSPAIPPRANLLRDL
jgi:predicted nucleic acid-binding protein